MIALRRIRISLVITLLVAFLGALPRALHADEAASPESRLAQMRMPTYKPKEAPVLAIYVEDHGMRRGPRGPQVVVALWKSGGLIWSSDRENGGPPYFATQVPWITSRSLVSQLAEKGVFEDTVRDDLYFGPDSTYTTLAICDGDHRLCMSSWHEHFERRGKSVALAGGVTALNGRDLDELIAQEPEKYRRFREVWKTVRSAVESVLPKNGMPSEKREFTLEPQPATPLTEEKTQKEEQIGELLGQPVFRSDLREFGRTDEKVGWAFMQPLVQHYCLQHHDAIHPTDKEVAAAVDSMKRKRQTELEANKEQLTAEMAEVEKDLAAANLPDSEREELEKRKRILDRRLNPPEVKPSIWRSILFRWKFQQHLYRNYGGGRIVFQQAGIEAFDAVHRWLQESEKAGDFSITDEELHTALYAYFTTVKHGSFLRDPGEPKNAELLKEFLHPAWLSESDPESP